MLDMPLTGPINEQNICVTCGMCCDGTLFFHALLQPGEMGNLPEKIEQNYRMENGKEFFLLPCLYFNGKCTIYNKKRADVCSGYRCQLLRDFAEGKTTLANALETVRGTLKMRSDIIEEYLRITGKNNETTFRKLLLNLGDIQTSTSKKESVNTEFDLFVARCNIFEALLIKHFRSTSEFEKMMTGHNTTDIRVRKKDNYNDQK